MASIRGVANADGGGFGVPCSAEENDNGRKVHPNKKADDRGKPAVYDTVGDAADVNREEHVRKPPQKGRDRRAGNHVAKAGFLGARNAIDHCQTAKDKKKAATGKKYDQRSWK